MSYIHINSFGHDAPVHFFNVYQRNVEMEGTALKPYREAATFVFSCEDKPYMPQ